VYKIRKDSEPAPQQVKLKTREELAALMDGLEKAMPQLMAENPDGADFMPLFADRADAIARQTDIADHDWLMDRVDALLEKNGKQGDEYLPPRDLILV